MDPFDDEFEFKPLTEGLGFHKKAETPAANSRRTTGTSSSEAPISAHRHLQSDAENDLLGRSNSDFGSRPSTNISELIASLPPALDFVGEETERSSRSAHRPAAPAPVQQKPVQQALSRPQIFQPLSRAENTKPAPKNKVASHAPSPAPYSQPMRPPAAKSPDTGARSTSEATTASGAASGYRQRLEESFARAFPSIETGRAPTKAKAPRPAPRPVAGDLTPVTAHFGAGALDALMVTGMSTLLLVFILAITHVNLRGLLSNAETDIPTRIHLFLLVITVLQLYMLTAHSFFGTTLGEWAFEIQLGTDREQKGALYPVQAAFRTLLLTVTGFVILPGISLLIRRDLSGAACGLQLYRRH